MAITWGRERPTGRGNSTALSSEAESLPPGVIRDTSLAIWPSCRDSGRIDWRALIQLTLPRMVLISPLCATYGGVGQPFQLGNVFGGEKRWWTRQSAL